MSGNQSTSPSLYPLVARRPAVPLVLLFIVGILLHPHVPVRPWSYLTMATLFVLSAAANHRRPVFASLSLAVATFICGLTLAQLHAHRYAADDIANYATDAPRLAQLELTVDYPPRVLSRQFDARPMPPRQVFTGTVNRVLEWEGWADASGQMLVQIDQPHPRLAVGQRLRVIGMLQRPSEAMNPGQFDWARYYREQRVLASLRVRTPDNVTILTQASAGPLDLLRDAARDALAQGFTARQSLDHALLRALLLGDSDPELRDVQDQFVRTGTSHHLAISGMHIAVLGGFVFGVCRLFALSPRRTTLVVACFVAVYGAAALPSPPVLRSVALCLFMGLGLLGRRSLDMLQMLALSALAMLIYDPLDLYNAGFQLSFITVLGLVLLTRPMIESLRRQDPILDAVVLHRRSRRQVIADWLRMRTLQIVAAALVAWLVSLPLVALHFERLNPWAMLASIILAPAVFAALIMGLIKVVLTLLLPSLAGTWATACVWPVSLMRWTVDWLAMFPGSDVAFPRPPIWLVLLYYALLCVPLLTIPIRFNIWRLARVGPAGVCLAAICVPLLLGAKAPPADGGGVRLTVLAIGAGSCAVLELPDRRAVVFDAGSLTLTDPVDRCIGPFLRHRGINRIEALFLSHANYDHFAAAAELIETYDVQRVYLPPQFARDAVGNPPAERLMKLIDQGGCAREVLDRGDSFALDKSTRVDVLWPPPDDALRMNESSLVLRLSNGGRSILLPGDVQDIAQQRLLYAGADLRADVLIAPHHGSFEPTTGAFLRAVAPTAVVSSNDRTLTLRQHDFAEVVTVPLYRTHIHGAVTIDIVDSAVEVTPFHRE